MPGVKVHGYAVLYSKIGQVLAAGKFITAVGIYIIHQHPGVTVNQSEHAGPFHGVAGLLVVFAFFKGIRTIDVV